MCKSMNSLLISFFHRIPTLLELGLYFNWQLMLFKKHFILQILKMLFKGHYVVK